ncbi:MAG: carboxylesterase/lipase family protein [Myxococcota bacterium]
MVRVDTPSGALEGERQGGAAIFRGIPYARPPVGSRRFRAPEPAAPWTGTRLARSFRSSAPQSAPMLPLLGRLIGGTAPGQSEDCLYLNVWTPAPDPRRRPVLVWIHGGAFVMGSGSSALYSGRRLAVRGDVVVVTLNYRLGALGFLNLRGLVPHGDDVPSNLGLRDQIAALEWVQRHIECFGGDPENVTLMGESAGAMSVGTLLGTPRAQGLFGRAILQSGAAHNVASREQAAHVAESLLREVGVDALDAGGLEKLSLSALLRAQRKVGLSLGARGGLMAWQPSLDDDLLTTPPLRTIESGLSKSVPVLIGTNRDEWRLFLWGDPQGRRLDPAGLRRRIERSLQPAPSRDVDLAVELYSRPRLDRGRPTPTDSWVDFQTDRIFRYPATRLAEIQSRHVPETYAYLFNWRPPLLRTRLGAAHGVEIPFVLGSLRRRELRPLIGWSPSALRLCDRMQQAWAHFARTGRPECDLLPDWPAYDPERRATQILGSDCFVEDAPLEETRRFWEGRLDR